MLIITKIKTLHYDIYNIHLVYKNKTLTLPSRFLKFVD